MTTDIIASIAIQLPLVALFIWYNDRKDRQFQAFLKEQREAYITALNRLTDKFDTHDQKQDEAIATMKERTAPRPTTRRKAN